MQEIREREGKWEIGRGRGAKKREGGKIDGRKEKWRENAVGKKR